MMCRMCREEKSGVLGFNAFVSLLLICSGKQGAGPSLPLQSTDVRVRKKVRTLGTYLTFFTQRGRVWYQRHLTQNLKQSAFVGQETLKRAFQLI
jgi:hypothetical protein